MRASAVVSIGITILAVGLSLYIFDTITNDLKNSERNVTSSMTNRTIGDLLGKDFFDFYSILPLFPIIMVVMIVGYIIVGFSGGRSEDEPTMPKEDNDIIQTSDLPGHFVSHKEDFVAVYQGERKESIRESKKLRRKNYWTKVINTDNTSTDGTWLVYRSQWKRTEERDRGVPRWTRRRNN